MRRGWWNVSMALAAQLAVRSASAQSACPSAAQSAVLETQGVQLNQSGDHEGALARFTQSYELCRGASAQGRMAVALIALGRWGEADTWMRRALALRSDPWIVANLARLEQQAGVIAPHVGELTVVGEGGLGEVFVDGRRVADFPMREPLRVTVGTVIVRVTAPGRHAVERPEIVQSGRLTRATVTLIPVQGDAPSGPGRSADPVVVAPPAQGDHGATTQRALGWVSAGVAAVGLGVGIWATAERFNRRDLYDRECPTGGFAADRLAYCDGLHDDVSDGSVLIPQVVGFAAAGAFAVTSVVLFLTAPTSTRSPRTAAFSCGPGPGSPGVICEGRF